MKSSAPLWDSEECHTEAVRFSFMDANSGQPVEADAFGLVAWGTQTDAILPCAPSLESLRAFVGDLTDQRARYEAAYFVEPYIGPPWQTDQFYWQDDEQGELLAGLEQRFKPHHKMLRGYVQDGWRERSSARIVRIVELDPGTGADLGTRYGVQVRGRCGSAITRSADDLAELAELVGGDLADERALWGFVQSRASYIGTWEGAIANPALGLFGSGGVKQPHAPVRTAPKVGRNDPCPCGSERKFKRCCYA